MQAFVAQRFVFSILTEASVSTEAPRNTAARGGAKRRL